MRSDIKFWISFRTFFICCCFQHNDLIGWNLPYLLEIFVIIIRMNVWTKFRINFWIQLTASSNFTRLRIQMQLQSWFCPTVIRILQLTLSSKWALGKKEVNFSKKTSLIWNLYYLGIVRCTFDVGINEFVANVLSDNMGSKKFSLKVFMPTSKM